MMRRQDQQSRVFYELSTLILNILRSPPTSIQFPDQVGTSTTASPALVPARMRRSSSSIFPSSVAHITPAGFASLMLGISLALMLCGSVTFFIGFMLMPWVLGLVMVFYFVGLISSLSVLGRSILCYATSITSPGCSATSPSSPRKDIPDVNFVISMVLKLTTSCRFPGPCVLSGESNLINSSRSLQVRHSRTVLGLDFRWKFHIW